MTGCGAPGAPGIIRCLRKNGERDIRIVAVDRNENAGARDLVDAFYTVPSAEKEDFLPAVLDICRRESVQVVIPIVTRELMKFARARAEFEALGAKVSVMEPDKLEIVNNKAHLLDAMRAHGLRTPEYRRVHTVEKLKAAVSALGYPEKALCVKAAVGNGSRGIRMLNANISRFDLFFEQKPNSMFISYEELIRTLSERETMPEMLVMEYLPGTEYSVDFLADHGEPIYTVSRRGLSVVTSNMMSLVVDDNPAVKEICTQVVRSLELDGNFGFDLLYNANDETPYVIEINPRLTAGVVSCAAAGVNLPYLGIKRLDLSRVMQCMDTTDGVMALFRHLQRTAQDCGFGEIGCFQVGGLSDSGITVACGVPTVCGMGVRGEGNHTPDEYAEVESLFQRSVLAACAAYTLNDDFAKAAE